MLNRFQTRPRVDARLVTQLIRGRSAGKAEANAQIWDGLVAVREWHEGFKLGIDRLGKLVPEQNTELGGSSRTRVLRGTDNHRLVAAVATYELDWAANLATPVNDVLVRRVVSCKRRDKGFMDGQLRSALDGWEAACKAIGNAMEEVVGMV